MEIWPKFRRNTLLRKSVSIFVVLSFALSNIAFADSLANKVNIPQKTESVIGPNTITIEKDYGLIKSRFFGNSNKLIINIQDAHCNYEAQTNIVNILESLIKNHSLSLISVEGADGLIDTTWFKAFPDEEVRKEVATYFMKKGEITGPEFLSITQNYSIKLFGAEDRASYIQNLNAFTSSYPLKADTEKYYNSIKAALSRLKGYIYSDELKAMDAKSQDYESKKLQFNDYVRFLQEMAAKKKINLRSYENLFRLISVLIYEKKIDFNVTDKERAGLIDELSKALSKDALTELVSQSISFKSGKISSVEFYNYLKKGALANDIDLAKKCPNLYNYIIYNSVYSRIDNEKLFQDIKAVETDIKEKLFSSDDQRSLDKLSRHIDILLGMLNIKLLNGDFNYYQTHKDEFTHEAFTDFIKKEGERYGLAYAVEPPTEAVAKSVPKLEEFYAIATKRDKALVDNTIKEMEREKQQIAVLVTGGFHSEGMAKLLEKQGISYIVVCPSITKDVPTPYIQILTNQRTPIEDILTSPDTAKKGMLAPISLAELVPMTPAEIAKFTSGAPVADAEIKNLINEIINRANEVKKSWVSLSAVRWLARALPVAKNHEFARNEKFMKDAYIYAMRLGLKQYIKDSGKSEREAANTANKIVGVIIKSEDFDSIFAKSFARIAPKIEGLGAIAEGGGITISGKHLSAVKHDTFKRHAAAIIHNGQARMLFEERIPEPEFGRDLTVAKDEREDALIQALRSRRGKLPAWFDVVILYDKEKVLDPTLVLHPGRGRQQAYISSSYIDTLSDLYNKLDSSGRARDILVDIILDAFRHETKHIELERPMGPNAPPLTEEIIDAITISYRARMIFRAVFANITVDKPIDIASLEKQLAYLDSYSKTVNPKTDVNRFLPVGQAVLDKTLPVLTAIHEKHAASILEALFNSLAIRAPPQNFLRRNPQFAQQLADKGVLFYIGPDTRPYVFLNPAILKEGHPRLMPTMIRMAVEARALVIGLGEDAIERRVERAQLRYLEYRYTPAVMAERINELIGDDRVSAMFAQRGSMAALNKEINLANSARVVKVADRLSVPRIYYIEDYGDNEMAIKALMNGALCISMPFAGAGSRMQNSLEELNIRLPAENLRLANIDIWQIAKEMRLIDQIPGQDRAKRYKLSERAMLALAQGILNLERIPGLAPEQIKQIRDNLKLTVSVSDEIEKESNDIFIKYNFFGLDPDNVVFIKGGYGPASELDDGTERFVPSTDPGKQRVSWNHGFAFTELAWIKGPERAYTLTRDGQKKPLEKPVVKYMLERGARYSCVHRINDLILLHPDMALDVQMLGAFLNLKRQEGINAYFEMMANPTAQKGGMALSLDGKHLILVEDLASKDEAKLIEKKLDALNEEELRKTNGKRGVPYNRLYGYFDLEAVQRALLEEEMPLSISQDKKITGLVSPEIPTGDITWLEGVKAVAGVRRHDILIDADDGILPNETRDENNNTIVDKRGKPIPAYEAGSGAIVHDCKEAKYIKDGLRVVAALDDPDRNLIDVDAITAASEHRDTGAIRGNGKGISDEDHGPRAKYLGAYNAKMARQERTLNGVVGQLIETRQAISLLPYNSIHVESKLDWPIPQIGTHDTLDTKGYDWGKITALEKAVGDKYPGLNFVIIRGLKEDLISNKIVPDLYFHYGETRNSVYIDESDFLYLLSLPKGVDLIMEAIEHEKEHIDNPPRPGETPDSYEARIETMAPTQNVRAAFAARDADTIRKNVGEQIARVAALLSASEKKNSLLFWPNHDFKQGEPLNTGLIVPQRNAEEVRALLQRARDEGVELSVVGHLRGVDGPGSSLDLPEFQVKLTPKDVNSLQNIPSTPTIASEFSVKIRFELADNPDVIEYVAPDYGIPIDKPYKITGLIEPNKETGKIPQGDAPAFIFRNIFGLKGVRIICEEVSPLALAGGMESSNVFNVALISAASMLSGANLSLADIFNLAVKLENDEFNGLTGGQGHLCCMIGGAYRHVWLSGMKGIDGRLTNPYAALTMPLLEKKGLGGIEEHMMLVQAGKEYENGKPTTGRTATLINWMWTDLLRDNDKIGVPLHQEKLGLADKYTRAMQASDFKTMAGCIHRYVEIRDQLCLRWTELMLAAHRGEKGLPEYAYAYEKKVWDENVIIEGKKNPYYESFKVVRDMYVQHGDALGNISLYTLEPIASLVKEAWDQNIAIMPLGAGGPGTNLAAVSPKGIGRIAEFLRTRGITEFTPEKALEARRLIRGEQKSGTIKGYVPFKVGTEPIRFNGFEELGLTVPTVETIAKVTAPMPDRSIREKTTGVTLPSVESVMQEFRKFSGLPVSVTTLPQVTAAGKTPSEFWSEVFSAVNFDTDVYRRVEQVDRKEGEKVVEKREQTTGVPAFKNAAEDTDINSFRTYGKNSYEGIVRTGAQMKPVLMNPAAPTTPEAYFMYRGPFANREDVQRAFYDNKVRYDITVIPPAQWGEEPAKTFGHYHAPAEMPEVYQVVSGEAIYFMQKCNEAGEIVDAVMVKAKAGDFVIMLPGYGHVSINTSPTKPLVMANWLTWHQKSYYGSFKDNRGAVYYATRSNNGEIIMKPNTDYKNIPLLRQMSPANSLPAFGLQRGEPIYNLVKSPRFAEKVKFLNHPQEFMSELTPEKTLQPAAPDELVKVVPAETEIANRRIISGIEYSLQEHGEAGLNHAIVYYLCDELGKPLPAARIEAILDWYIAKAEQEGRENEEGVARVREVLMTALVRITGEKIGNRVVPGHVEYASGPQSLLETPLIAKPPAPLPKAFSSARYEWAGENEIRDKQNHSIVFTLRDGKWSTPNGGLPAGYENGETGAARNVGRAASAIQKTEPAKMSAADLSRTVITPDIAAMEATMMPLAFNKEGLTKEGKVVVVWDNGVSDVETTHVALQASRLVEKYLGDAVINVRGDKDTILSQVRDIVLREPNIRAIITITNDKTLGANDAETGATIEAGLKALHEKSRILSVQNMDGKDRLFVPVPALYDLALRIGFEQPIADCLARIGIATATDENGRPIDPMSDLWKILRIIPRAKPINVGAEAEAQKAAKNALERAL